MRVTLASVAIGEPYETSLRKMGASASLAGFDTTLLWTRQQFLADPLAQEHRAALEHMQRNHAARKKRHPYDRPYCGAFKSFVLYRALNQSAEGDYVLWADASKYHSMNLQGVDVRRAIEVLTGKRAPRRPPSDSISIAYNSTEWFQARLREPRRSTHSAYGVIHCHGVNCDEQLYMANYYRWSVNSRTQRAYPELVPDAEASSRRPHMMNANILLQNNELNRRLMRAWMDKAVSRPDAFCSSGPQEQAVFSILVQSANVPLVNACPYLRLKGWNACQDLTKSASWFLRMLASGAFEVVASGELDGGLVAAHRELHHRWAAANPHILKSAYQAGGETTAMYTARKRRSARLRAKNVTSSRARTVT